MENNNSTTGAPRTYTLEELKDAFVSGLDAMYSHTKAYTEPDDDDEFNKWFESHYGDRLPLTFEECIREEFLINTQNYPKEYHKLFGDKFKRAKKRFESQ